MTAIIALLRRVAWGIMAAFGLWWIAMVVYRLAAQP